MPDLDHRIEARIDGNSVRVLRMPYYAQNRKEWLCFVFSVQMCLEYFAQYYPNPNVRQHVSLLRLEDIITATHTRVDTGTTFDSVMLRRLNRAVRGVGFTQTLNARIDRLAERLDDNLPTIIIYNGEYYTNSDVGPGHAGVLVGMLDEDPIFNNPWLGMHVRMDRVQLERSWEVEQCRAVLLSPRTMQEQLEVADERAE